MARPISNEERASEQARQKDAERYIEVVIDCLIRKYGVIVTHRTIRDHAERYAGRKRTEMERKASYEAFGI